MRRFSIGLLNKKRRNFQLQEKFVGFNKVVDETSKEVLHHREALIEAGYNVSTIEWGPDFINDLRKANVDLVFNVSSMVEAAILEEIEMPYVGSDTFTIAIATDKSLTKRMWQHVGLPTSPFHVAKTEADCRTFKEKPPFDYPLFIKPLAGRGSAGINEKSVIENYDQLVKGVLERYETIGQPVLIEKFLKGREITFGILGNDEDTRALPPLEIVFSEGEVTLTYEQKEMDNDRFICPAKLTKEKTLEMQLLAIKAYKVLGFKDYGRIDAILTEDGPFLLEGNTFAGLMCTPVEKPHSYMGFMAVTEGKHGKELLDEIVLAAIKRYDLR
ncbi:MAG: hypothetical protein E3J28_05425 [Desulfobacteraceae bacterium]|nr:MAG: hypothetical protein E3J28_05425 [Desulfobacteraceae bacterium]